ncbi:MAG: hypothetical protein KAI24_05440 [Planctomycetes bacterium]|nr:hypothetical protein [Planctomycetota bacterium]
MIERDRRALLWLTCAAVCWRWLVAVRTPLPGVDATRDLWLAERLANGDFGALAARWWEPLNGLLMAPALALGASPFATAQVLACLLGGLAVLPAALAAERLRPGAGVPAAVVVMVGSGAVVAAGAGGSTAMVTLVVACAWWAFAHRRPLAFVGLAALALLAGGEQIATHAQPALDATRLGLGGAAFGLAFLLPAAVRTVAAPAAAFVALLLAAALLDGWATLLPSHLPLLAVLVGVGLARLHVRVRDLLLCALVAVECHAAWTLVEPRSAVVERIVPQYLQRRLGVDSDRVVTDLPRVRWACGQRPDAGAVPLGERARAADVEAVVLTSPQARDATLRAALAARFEPARLPTDLLELCAEHGVVVLRRRDD